MAKILAFEKIYNYLNDEFESIKNSLLGNGELLGREIPLDEIKIRYNGGDIETTLNRTTRTFTVLDDIAATDCRVFKAGNIELSADEYTAGDKSITIAKGKALSKFNIRLHNQVADYLSSINCEYTETPDELLEKYVSNGVIEALPIELEDTRTIAYYQPIAVRITSDAAWRNNIMLLCEHFATTVNDQITVIDGFVMQIRATQMPTYTQSYKAHGTEEFDTQLMFDAYITTAPDFAEEESVFIDGVLVPYATFETTKQTILDTDTNPEAEFTYVPQRNDFSISITGLTYSDNTVLQALKMELRSPKAFANRHEIKLQKGEVLAAIINDRTIIVPAVQSTEFIKLYNTTIPMVLDIDYTIDGDNTVTVLDENIVMTDIIVIYGQYAYIQGYSTAIQSGKISNVYGGNISYDITFQLMSELLEEL